MRMSVTIDPELVEEVRLLANVSTKREAIEQALREFAQRRRVKELVKLAGSGASDMDLDELMRWRDESEGHQ